MIDVFTDAQLDALADRFVDRLAPRLAARVAALHAAEDTPAAAAAAPRLVSAQTLAAELGVSRAWIYDHADALGAVRLGDGPRPRIRFDLETARAATACCTSKPSQGQNSSTGAESWTQQRRRPRRSPKPAPKPGSVLGSRPRRIA